MSPLLRAALAMCALVVHLSALALLGGFSTQGCGSSSYIPVPVYEAGSSDVAAIPMDAPTDTLSDAPAEATDAPTDAPADTAADAPADAAVVAADVGPG